MTARLIGRFASLAISAIDTLLIMSTNPFGVFGTLLGIFAMPILLAIRLDSQLATSSRNLTYAPVGGKVSPSACRSSLEQPGLNPLIHLDVPVGRLTCRFALTIIDLDALRHIDAWSHFRGVVIVPDGEQFTHLAILLAFQRHLRLGVDPDQPMRRVQGFIFVADAENGAHHAVFRAAIDVL